jgi:hypothetical protein
MTAASTRWWPRFAACAGRLIDRLYLWRLGGRGTGARLRT